MKTAKEIATTAFPDCSLESIKAAAKKLQRKRTWSVSETLNVTSLIFDIDWLQECAFLGPVPITPRQIADVALRVGLRWAALQTLIEHPKGTGKTEWPEWEFIRKAYRKRTRQKEIIEEGLRLFKDSTGKESTRPVSAFIPHFKEQVKTKIHVKP